MIPAELRAQASNSREYRLLRFPGPEELEPGYLEKLHYEQGQAEQDAAAFPGEDPEPWLNVLKVMEPESQPALQWLLAQPALAPFVRGRVLDMGAGSCWLTALLSRQPAVAEVTAFDLAEKFLLTAGARVLERLQAEHAKVCFATGDMNRLAYPAGHFDCVFLFACIHHSLAPLLALHGVRRVLRPGGRAFLLEHPVPAFRLRGYKSAAGARSPETATEIPYARWELEWMLRQAGFPRVIFHRLPARSRGALRGLLRSFLYLAGLEDSLRPPGYLIEAGE